MHCNLNITWLQPGCGTASRPNKTHRCRASGKPAASRLQSSTCERSGEHDGGQQYHRREALGLLAGASLAWTQSADAAKPAAPPPPAPPTGACSDCVGEIDSTLNACNLQSPSCVSSQNEDESHFEAPWQYEGSQKAAVKRLIKAVTEEPLNDRSPQGILVDHHQGSDGSDYVRFVFGKRPRGAEDWKMDDALDAEFLFLAGANHAYD
ncbi:hypothetical protein WJX84_010014 [Apatococcus fuscideae]|uniref:Uncharacterized protein n=1 Tax=Apatococcus fuscideae TaxID=2026836 RepID=A0AAW1T0A4_9CHLO